MEKKRTGNVVAVTVAKCATIYIEANTYKEAIDYAERYADEVDDRYFEDSEVEVYACEPCTTPVDESFADEIWIEDGCRMSYDEYMDALDAQDEAEELEAIRAQEEKLAEFKKRQQQINFEDYGDCSNQKCTYPN
jgi:hypothetical protein